MIPKTDHLKTAAAVLFVLAVVPFVLYAVPQLAGATQSYVVLSDSMSPTIHAGDVVFVADRPTAEISEGDVVTFSDAEIAGSSGTSLVTHRVVEVTREDGKRAFRTKGDANEEADNGLVSASDIVGVVTFSIPYIGWVLAFGQTRLGTILLVVVPFGLLALSELWTFADELIADSDDSTEDVASDGETP